MSVCPVPRSAPTREMPSGSASCTQIAVTRVRALCLLLLFVSPLLLVSCYTQVRDPNLTVLQDPSRGETPQGKGVEGSASRAGESPRLDRRERSQGPSEGTLILVVDYATLEFERWILIAASPWPAGGRDLEIRADRERELQTVSFRYPGTEAVIFSGSSVWGGSGRIEFPEQWRPYHALPRGGHEAAPTWMRVYSALGPGEVVLYEELPYAHEAGQDLLDLWYAVSDRELVSNWVENGAWVGAYLYKPSPEPGLTIGAKWILFVRG